MGDLISVVILDVKVDLPLLNLHDGATRAFAQIWVRLQQLVKFTLCDFVLDCLRQVLSNLTIANNSVAHWAVELP